MSHQTYPITMRPLGPISDIRTAEKAIRDLEQIIRQLLGLLNGSQATPGTIKVLSIDENHHFGYYELQAGMSITIAVDPATDSCLISTP